MANRLHVATRKGFFTLKRDGDRWETERVSFLGDPVSMVFEDSRDKALYAGLDLGHFGVKLRRSRDGGENWDELACPQYPEDATVGAPMGPPSDDAPKGKPASLSYIWSLESAGDDNPGCLWAGTIPGGLFHSDDCGDSWKLVESLWNDEKRSEWFGGGMDDPGIHSICVDPRDSNHVSVAVSCGGVWVTRDGGQTWRCRADGMRAEYMPPERANDPNIQDPHLMVLCPSDPDHYWVQHHNGVFRSTDDCESWVEIENATPSVFGFAVAVHPNDPNTAWFAPAVKDECRVPVDAKLVVTRTTDGGKTFEMLSDGLPDGPAYDIIFRHCLAVDDTGQLLVLGSSTGALWISHNGGENWRLISAHLPQIYAAKFGG
jgi:photosystem II stability/assembly factor-like uncharacterized protein